jgi:hypothetical protein
LAWKGTSANPLSELEVDILRVLEQLITIYSNAPEKERIYIRKMMHNHPGVAMYLQVVATGNIRKFTSDIAPERVYPALIALSMADSDFGDYRDLLVLLGSLWLLSAQTGTDPAQYFSSVAALSDSKGNRVGEQSMSTILANFHMSAYFKESVRPSLPKSPAG